MKRKLKTQWSSLVSFAGRTFLHGVPPTSLIGGITEVSTQTGSLFPQQLNNRLTSEAKNESTFKSQALVPLATGSEWVQKSDVIVGVQSSRISRRFFNSSGLSAAEQQLCPSALPGPHYATLRIFSLQILRFHVIQVTLLATLFHFVCNLAMEKKALWVEANLSVCSFCI